VDPSKQAPERGDGPSLRIDESGFADPISAGTRSLLARSTVDVMLAPSRFIFRSLELPLGARQFLDGVVRSQIDRFGPNMGRSDRHRTNSSSGAQLQYVVGRVRVRPVVAQLSRSAYVRKLLYTASSSDQSEAALRVELARSSRVGPAVPEAGGTPKSEFPE
jgi:hypothetical protein